MEQVIAIVPARGGSKGIQRKNLSDLGGIPLVAWSILAARAAKNIDRVVIDTEDEEIASVAQKWGAEVPFLRAADLAQDNVSVARAVDVCAARLTAEARVPVISLVLFPTHPFRTPTLLEDTVELCRTTHQHVSVGFTDEWESDQWFLEREEFCESIRSNQSGAILKVVGLAMASYRHPLRRSSHDIVEHLERLLAPESDLTSRECIQRLQHSFERLSPEKIPSRIDHYHTEVKDRFAILPANGLCLDIDIDHENDLEAARRLLREGEVPWIPSECHEGKCDSVKSTSSGNDSTQVRVCVFQDNRAKYSEGEEIDLSALEILPPLGNMSIKKLLFLILQ